MGYWDKNIRGFVPQQNEEGTLPEYTDEQINDMLNSGVVVTGEDGLPTVMPFPEPTAEEKQTQYEQAVERLIRERYTVSQELAILRQQATKAEEYTTYFNYCEQCKDNAYFEVYAVKRSKF